MKYSKAFACYYQKRASRFAAALIIAFASSWLAIPESLDAAIPQAERDALIALYNKANGANWYNKIGWLGNAGTECSWAGVTCDTANGSVIGLEIYGPMAGSLPLEIANMTQLQFLRLPWCQLSGTIPNELVSLSHLLELNLSGNQLTGSIPSNLGSLAQLQKLDLSWNQLSGVIPNEIGNLPHLLELALSGNQLSGTLPSALGSLTELQNLSLSSNQLTGTIPAAIGNLAALQSLYLSGNGLSGSIPPALGNLSQLQHLGLSDNLLTGSIPTEIGNLIHLVDLNLSGDPFGNQLSGNIPSSLGNLTKLQYLYLSGNQLSGNIPATLGSLVSLPYLNLSDNQLTGGIPPELGNLSQLGSLNLSNNQLSGVIPDALVNLVNLSNLDLSWNHLNGSIPAWLGSLSQLGGLDLSGNQLSGGIPAELGRLRLWSLELANNQLTGTIPAALGDITYLSDLDLSGNQFSGSIPPELGKPQRLNRLYLSDNRLTGEIPATLGNVQWLTELRLDSNLLEGSIPATLGNLTALSLLDLSLNRLSGTIPASLTNMEHLGYLSLYGNQLSGVLPAGMSSLTPSQLYIGYNALFANDMGVLNHLDSRAPGWDSTQTVAPADSSGTPQSYASILLSWEPIFFSGGSGRYEAWMGSSPGGPVALNQSTPDKSSNSLALTSLTPAKTYYVSLRTVTDPHTFNTNTVYSDFGPQLAVAAGSEPSQDLTLGAGGAGIAMTMGGLGTSQAGYATLGVTPATAPYGTAVFSFKQNGITVSEAGVPASPPTTSARIFVDYRTGVTLPGTSGSIDIYTGFAAVNRGTAAATITLTLRDVDSNIISSGSGSLAKGAHIAKFITQLDQVASGFAIPSSFPVSTRFGTLEIASSQPLSVLALRLTTNQRGETLLTSTPIADLALPSATETIYFPQFVDGGGYSTSILLLNTSNVTETGMLKVYTDQGAPLVVHRVGGTSSSSFSYSIPSSGAFVFQTDGSSASLNQGWVELSPDGNSPTPVGAGVFQFSQDGILVTESGIPSATPTTHARVFVDTSAGHSTGLALGNPGNATVNVALTAFQVDGSTSAGISRGPVGLPAKGHIASFVGQLIDGLPDGFRGVLDVVGDSQFTALTLRSLTNERGSFLLTTFPIADLKKVAPYPIVFPQIADGGGFTTEFVLLSSGPSASVTLSFFGESGSSLAIGK